METSPPAASDATVLPDRPIIIVGCPRSGTTLLQLMLHAHPRIAIPPETRHLLATYRHRVHFGDLTKPKGRAKAADYMMKRPRFGDLKLDKQATKAHIVDGPGTVGSAIGIPLRDYAARFDKPRWGDKRPAYLNELSVLYALFPDAQVIHIVRDGRACVASLKRMPWWQGGSVGAMSRWVQSMRCGAKARKRLRPDQYYEVMYERIVEDPRAELVKLCEWLGEDFHESMLAPQEMASAAVPSAKRWHSQTHQEVSAAPVEKWKNELEPWEIALFELFARKWLKHYGYARTAKGRPVSPIKYGLALAHLLNRERTVRRLHRIDRQVAKGYDQPVAAQLTSGQIALAVQRNELRVRQPT